MIIVSMVLVLVLTVRGGRALRALRRGPLARYEWTHDELPADYGLRPERPWERRRRRST